MNAFQIISIVIALVMAGIGAWTFYRNVKIKRAEWLYVLYQKFYENESLKIVRSDLIYHPERFSVMNLPNEEIAKYPAKMQFAEAADDFLNFFEFKGSLHKLGQITTEKALMLFRYYLGKIDENEHLQAYLKPEGYENLVSLLGVVKTNK